MCLALRVEHLRWIMLMAAVESQQSICDGDKIRSTVSRTPTTVSDPFLRKLQITKQPSQLHHY